jgi:hypothetical protein
MSDNYRDNKHKIDKFRKMYEKTQGGIFWNRTRDKLLTKKGIQLFIETATENNVNQVFNEETLKPFVDALLYRYTTNSTKTKIAQMFIETGFSYLRQATLGLATPVQKRAIDDAMDLTKQLTFLSLPDDEREKFKLELGIQRMW